jgi:hypothetical protein
MRAFGIVIFFMLMSIPALGDDVPFAAPPGAGNDLYHASLSDIMGMAQLRHIKLWYAGRCGNWQLTNFEIKQIEESLGKAAMYYRNIPVEYIATIEKSLGTLRQAQEKKSVSLFSKGFSDLNDACNSCHQAAQVGFIVIQTPTSSPFTNQKFDTGNK